MRQLPKGYNAWLWIAAIVAGFLLSLLPPRHYKLSERDANLCLDSGFGPLSCMVTMGVHQCAQQVAENQWRTREGLRHQEELRLQFVLCTTAEELRPEDLGFRRLWPDEQIDPHFRPFYPTYIPRRNAPFDEIAVDHAHAEWPKGLRGMGADADHE